ncbi:MAG: hypothetical protein D6681_05650 [Calditrichaeota bacterium]|nr:MAG: hypothetical protein D6681_05650 [Calditrichota bacterium]
MQDEIRSIFGSVLELELAGPIDTQHGDHFRPDSVSFSNRSINAFSNFITANIGGFPLSSTSAGLTFDFSTGKPVATTTSLGPIFGERAQTLGKGRINLGFNFSFLNLNKIRGLNTRDILFTFTHQDVKEPGLGDSDNEFDTIDLLMNLDLDASVLAFVGTVGLTNNLDVGVAVPFVSIRLEARPVAVINSFTAIKAGAPNHFFGDPSDPQLRREFGQVESDATGIGDVAVRAKYRITRGDGIHLAILGEYRFPTGDEENFLGNGDPTVKAGIIVSGTHNNFGPHLNLTYEARTTDLDRDEIEVFAGFDQKVTDFLTIAMDVVGEFEVGSEITTNAFSDPVVAQRFITDTTGTTVLFRQVTPVTNIPQYTRDDLINAALGFKLNPREGLLIIGNVFVPLNDRGLRSDWIPTVGFEFTF